jgi:regulator of replication initiation timing
MIELILQPEVILALTALATALAAWLKARSDAKKSVSTSDLNILREIIDEVQAENKVLRTENRELRSWLTTLSQQVADLKAQNMLLNDDRDTLQQRITELSEENAALRSALKALKKELDGVVAENKRVRDDRG